MICGAAGGAAGGGGDDKGRSRRLALGDGSQMSDPAAAVNCKTKALPSRPVLYSSTPSLPTMIHFTPACVYVRLHAAKDAVIPAVFRWQIPLSCEELPRITTANKEIPQSLHSCFPKLLL